MVKRKDDFDNFDDWGVELCTVGKKVKGSSVGLKKKVLLGILSVSLLGSLGFWVFSPAKEGSKEEQKQEKNYNNLTAKSNNYGYPDNVEVPKNVEKVIGGIEGDVNKEGRGALKTQLEDIRSSVVETEKDWDVTKLGSRKYIDNRLPTNIEMVLLEDNSPLKLVFKHVTDMGMRQQLKDGFYLVINPLDEAQMYLKKEFYERAEKDTTSNFLVYINDVSQYYVPEMILNKAGYGSIEKFYNVEERLKIKDYPMVIKIQGGHVVSKKTNVKDLGGL